MYLNHRDNFFNHTVKILSNFIQNPNLKLNFLLSINPEHRPQAFFFLKAFDLINAKDLLELARNNPELQEIYIYTGFQLGQFNDSLYLASFFKEDYKNYLEKLFKTNPFYLIPSIRNFIIDDIDADIYKNPLNLQSAEEIKSELGNVDEHSSRNRYLELICLLELFLDDVYLRGEALKTQHQPFFEYLPFHISNKLSKEKYINYVLNNYTGLFTDLFIALYFHFPTFKGKITIDQGLLNSLFRVFNSLEIESLLDSQWFKFKDTSKIVCQNILDKSHKALSSKHKFKGCDFVICIAGQWRGGNDCVDYWFECAQKKGIPLFISTWETPGFSKWGHKNGLKERLLPDILAKKLPLISDDEIFESFPDLKKYIEDYTSSIKTNYLINEKKLKYPDVNLFEIYNNELLFKQSFEEKYGRLPTPVDLGNYNKKKVFEIVEKHSSELNIIDTTNIIVVRPDLEIISLNHKFIEDNRVLSQSIKFGYTCGDYIVQFKYENKEFFSDLFNFHAENPFGDNFRKENGPTLLGGSARYFGNFVDLLDVNFIFLRNIKLPLDEISNKISSQARESIPGNLLELYDEALLHSNK